MQTAETKWLLKDKIVRDFKGFPIGRVKKVWHDDIEGPLVVVERQEDYKLTSTWETIPLREVDSVTEEIRLKPPAFAE